MPRELPADITPYLVQPATRVAMNVLQRLVAESESIPISDRRGGSAHEAEESFEVDRHFPDRGCRSFAKEHFSISSRGCTPALLRLMRTEGWMCDLMGLDSDSDAWPSSPEYSLWQRVKSPQTLAESRRIPQSRIPQNPTESQSIQST